MPLSVSHWHVKPCVHELGLLGPCSGPLLLTSKPCSPADPSHLAVVHAHRPEHPERVQHRHVWHAAAPVQHADPAGCAGLQVGTLTGVPTSGSGFVPCVPTRDGICRPAQSAPLQMINHQSVLAPCCCCSDTDITGTLPPQYSTMTALDKLDAASAKLTGPVPDRWVGVAHAHLHAWLSSPYMLDQRQQNLALHSI